MQNESDATEVPASDPRGLRGIRSEQVEGIRADLSGRSASCSSGKISQSHRRRSLSVGSQAKGEKLMSIAEILLVIGIFGICTGVWTTLVVIIRHHKINQLDARTKNTDERINESRIP